MTISAFCREQLREHGPLTLDALTERAVAAGKTRSQSPAATVRSAIASREVLLPDGRWATPLSLLEGRWLTTRRLGLYGEWSPEDIYDEEPAGDDHDLALLLFAVNGGHVPLATGGVLRRASYCSAWAAPDKWPFVHASRGELLGLRVVEGVLHVELIARSPALIRRGRELAAAIGPLDHKWGNATDKVKERLAQELWTRMADDPTFLREPVPPLSECIPTLETALRAEAARRREASQYWRPVLELPSSLQCVAIEEARQTDLLTLEWLNRFVTHSLRDLQGAGEPW